MNLWLSGGTLFQAVGTAGALVCLRQPLKLKQVERGRVERDKSRRTDGEPLWGEPLRSPFILIKIGSHWTNFSRAWIPSDSCLTRALTPVMRIDNGARVEAGAAGHAWSYPDKR